MSDKVKCDFCGNYGKRRMGTLAPQGWFYLEAQDSDNPSNCLIMWACSKECADKQWKPGPGKLNLTGE